MDILYLTSLVFCALILRIFFVVQDYLFKKTYYAFYEFVTGLPKKLSLKEIVLVRFLPPLIIGFVFFIIFPSYPIENIALIGFTASIFNAVPAFLNIVLGFDLKNNGINTKKLGYILVIYLSYIVLFSLLTFYGGYLSKIFSKSLIPDDLFSFMRDNLIFALFTYIFTKIVNKPIS